MQRKRKTGKQVLSQIERMYNNPRMTGSRRNFLDAVYGETEERLVDEGNRQSRLQSSTRNFKSLLTPLTNAQKAVVARQERARNTANKRRLSELDGQLREAKRQLSDLEGTRGWNEQKQQLRRRIEYLSNLKSQQENVVAKTASMGNSNS